MSVGTVPFRGGVVKRLPACTAATGGNFARPNAVGLDPCTYIFPIRDRIGDVGSCKVPHRDRNGRMFARTARTALSATLRPGIKTFLSPTFTRRKRTSRVICSC